ncbi:MAG TPA: F0F1 ATP synthase subunit epsilon [Solirubrobacterales bacterium]|jgi:F-type H+-transporting ATPase subunit epsilon|nr:F0F1 ATP synthase subunit epsilon [Solirubrobacterales bacterium]
MAYSKFPVEVMTPEGAAFEGEVEMVSTRTTIGTLGIRANHEPIMTMLDPTELRLYRSESDIARYAQGEGYLQMADNHALLLVEECIPVDELDLEDLREKLGEAEARREECEAGSAAHERAERDVRRWSRYIEIATS